MSSGKNRSILRGSLPSISQFKRRLQVNEAESKRTDTRANGRPSEFGRPSESGEATWRKCNRIYQVLNDEAGSISPLIITYFLITLLVVFIGINITHSYLERRHLILAIESSLQRASQQVDDWRYYTGNIEDRTLRFQSRGVTTFIPIDCGAAQRVFNEEFPIQWTLTQVLNRPDGDTIQPSPFWIDFRHQESRSNVSRSEESTVETNSSEAKISSDAMDSRERMKSASAGTVRSVARLSSIPTINSFRCDGKTIGADAELLVELPFSLSFAGVEFLRFSRQQASVEVGLIFGG